MFGNPSMVLTLNPDTFGLTIADISDADYPISLDGNGNLVCSSLKMFAKYVGTSVLLGHYEEIADKWTLGKILLQSVHTVV